MLLSGIVGAYLTKKGSGVHSLGSRVSGLGFRVTFYTLICCYRDRSMDLFSSLHITRNRIHTVKGLGFRVLGSISFPFFRSPGSLP